MIKVQSTDRAVALEFADAKFYSIDDYGLTVEKPRQEGLTSTKKPIAFFPHGHFTSVVVEGNDD